MGPSTGSLIEALKEYLESQGIVEANRADAALGLLRINTRESLQAAGELMGRAVERCPAALSPRPPGALQRRG